MSDEESLTQQRLTYLERELRVVRAELASLLARVAELETRQASRPAG